MAEKDKPAADAIRRRLEDERWTRRLAEKEKRRVRRRKKSGYVFKQPHLGQSSYGTAPRFEMQVPPVLDLVGAHEATCTFVRAVSEHVRAGQRVCLVFTGVTQIRASALMYLLSTIHRLRIEHGVLCITGTYPDKPSVERLLSQSGFYELLQVKSRDAASRPRSGTRYIRFKSDQKIAGERIGEVRAELLRDDLRMPPSVARTIFRALSEAMTNVHHHAYLRKAFPSPRTAVQLRGRWWLFATLNASNDVFCLVFYDAGVGIPKTLPRKYGIELIRQALALLPTFEPDDAQMIAAAMVLGRTRTDMDNRGKGLLDLARLIDLAGEGKMHIYSRHGTYTYTPTASTQTNSPGFLEGTLIEWRLPLAKALETLPETADEGNNDA